MATQNMEIFCKCLHDTFNEKPVEMFCNLNQQQAEARFKSVKAGSVKYDINLVLLKGSTFNGRVHINFDINDKDSVFLQYVGTSFEFVSVNGKEVPKVDGSHEYLRHHGYLMIPQDLLEDSNTVEMSFVSNYNNDGNGFHSYTDIDGSQYVYTQNEPGWCNRLFPVFDQPDLKAPYTLKCTAPNEWKVIATEPVKSKEPVGDDATKWTFDWTCPLSSYLYTCIAGPYREIVAAPETLYRGITMSIYCRSTLFEYIDAQQKDIFEFNSDGLERYDNLFGFLYPFKKIDSIFCPEFTVGAMENPGAVTYTEHYAFKKVPTKSEISQRGSTIIHELAHMWFGNAVTMKWWNNLWLNESFADFVNYVIMGDQYQNLSFDIDYAWCMFNMRKGWGYRADQLDSTHPIYGDVPDLAAAESIFDGITYSKGAATMRQLYALIGREVFSESMKRYFNKFAYSNATLEDLLGTMQTVLNEKNGDDLRPELHLENFNKTWIQTAGLNTVNCVWDKETLVNSGNLVLKQGVALEAYPTLRYHKMRVGFYDENAKLLAEPELILQNTGETQMNVSSCDFDRSKVCAVVPNVGDMTFIKIILDATSLEF